MNSFFRLAPVIALALLAACHSDPKTAQTATTADAPATAEAPPASPAASAAANSPGASYRQYRGLVSGRPDSLTLELTSAPRRFEGVQRMGSFGSYYGPDGHPRQLMSVASSAPDSLLLFEFSADGEEGYSMGPRWKLLRRGATLVGTHQGRPVQLREVAPAQRLVVRFAHDSVVAYPGVARSPVAHIRFQALLANGAPDALNPNLLRGLRGDTLPGLAIGPFSELWAQRLAGYRKMYREDTEGGRDNPPNAANDPDMPYGYGLGYESEESAYVLWNQPPLLSVAVYSYSFTGGAHGNYATTTATYDTRTGQRLRYEDIFRPDSEAQLSKMLNKAVRRTLRLPTSAPLDGTLFVKTMPVTHNVYLTSTGAVFTYTPYEIASYAQGEIPVFVPNTELQPLLRNQPVL